MAQERKLANLGNAVVIGGNGNLGFAIVNQLLSSWNTTSVTSIDLRCQRNVNPKAKYHECDISDGPKLLKLFAEIKPDLVIHTASPIASDNTVSHALFKKVNIDGTQCVVDACQKTGVKALVYTSSASVVCNSVDDIHNADERWPVLRGRLQKEYYSETKAAAEEIVLKANRQSPYKLVSCSLRPAGIFGEGDPQVIRGMMKVLRDGRANWQIGDNTNLFDFTYVGNVAHAHLLAAHRLLATSKASVVPLDHERVDGEAFFITNGQPAYFWDFPRAVWRAAGYDKPTSSKTVLSKSTGTLLGSLSEIAFGVLGKEPTFTALRARLSCVTRYYNITKAKMLLDYEPLWTLQEGIDRSVKYYLEQEKADAEKKGQ